MSSRGRATAPRLRALSRARFDESAQVGRAAIQACAERVAEAGALLAESFRDGGKLLAFGNGGSAAQAEHLAAELAGRFRRERPALPALALTANGAELTALGNDYGFEAVFARLVQAHGRPGDVALALSTSGDSPNVCAAVREAREAGLHTVGLTGGNGGKLAGLVDVAVVAPSDVTARIQECHTLVLHVLCELVDEALFPDPGARGT